jgi:Spy/CpxP family protein refolding chaperone
MRRKMALAGLTAALLLVGSAGSFAQNPPEKIQPRGAWFFAGQLGERLAKFLELTPDQQAKFDEVRKARQDEAKAFREEMRQLRPELREAMKDPKADQKRIDGLIDQLGQARAAHLKSLVRSVKDLEKVLTPEQLEKYRKVRSRISLRRGSERGFGPRRWMRPGRGPRHLGGPGWGGEGWF